MSVQTELRFPSDLSVLDAKGSRVSLAEGAAPSRKDEAMRRTAAALGTSIFFALAPGTVAGLVPWWLTGWHLRHVQAAAWIPVRVLGGVLIVAGLPVLVEAMRTRGYAQPLIEKLCFRNWLRVLQRTWSGAETPLAQGPTGTASAT